MNINKIGFENFRVFKDKSKIELAPITVLTGANSSGKSTVIKGLKLFQNFWSQTGFKHKLEFEKGIHQLGDFEMALSKNSDSKEFIITYEFDHIALNTLIVELTFHLDNSSPLKNGVLQRARIRKGEDILYAVIIENNNQYYGYNYKYIYNELLPHLQNEFKKLEPEKERYNKIINEDTDTKTHDNGLTFRFLDITKLNLKKLGIDYNRYWELETFFNCDFSKKYPEREKFPDFNFQKPPYIYDLEILKIFVQIEKSNSLDLVAELWKLLKNHYSEIESRFSYNSFREYIEKLETDGVLHINLWKESFLLNKEITFSEYLKRQIELSLVILSKVAGSSPFGISDIEEFFKHPFYNPARTVNETIWQNSYEMALNSKTQSLNEKAVVNCHQIYSDAFYLEQNLLGKDLKNKDLNILSLFERLFINIYKEIEDQFSKMYFIDSIRATSQRLYTSDNQNISFNDFIVKFLKRDFKEKEKSFVERWLREFEIADKFEIELVRGIGSEVFIVKDNEKINLVDMGYGVTQFLPILLKIIYCNNTGKRRIVIEEPETNLHPKFQSKLADLFVDAYNTFNINFIIETHSEYFIRKLQFLTAKKEIDTTDSIIYYLSSPDKNKREVGEEQLSKIQIQSNGRLSKPFGSGFYDEADNLSLEMMKYSLN